MMAQARPQELTRSVEDYLKAVYHLTRDGTSASTSGIAEMLDVAAPSVSGMLKRLAEQGLVDHVPYRGVELTTDGRRAALRMVRRHRIIEAYLVDRLGYSWDSVHEEAERLEHAVSDSLIERMAMALGNPQFDPHGDPIPDSQGRIEELLTTPLSEIPVGETVEVLRVETGDPSRLRYLGSSAIVPGTLVRVVAREPFHGPVTVHAGDRDQVLGHDMAQLVHCARPAPTPA